MILWMYLKGYYGYKNFWDEILLLWLLPWIQEQFTPSRLVIETWDVEWLQERLDRHEAYLWNMKFSIRLVDKRTYIKHWWWEKIFGWWEVFTDARPLPYNGWNYLIGFFSDILLSNYHIVGGIWTIKRRSTKRLYSMLLRKAKSITVRENFSYDIASTYNKNVSLYHDFAYDILDRVHVTEEMNREPYYIINVNPYIWNEETKTKIMEFVKTNNETATYRFVPWEIWSDWWYYELLRIHIPELRYYDRTENSIDEICSFFSWSSWWIAARLHVLLLLKYYNKSLIPLVYQEKVQKIIWT